MSAVELQNPILDGGIRSVNFFNGRLLTARDLSREQDANREATNRLGQAVGDGVAYGLEVSKSQSPDNKTETPILTIEAGLAINRQGLALRLTNKTDISLVQQASASAVVSKTFGECSGLQFGTSLTGDGLFLLTLAPATKSEGKATVSGLDALGSPCNTDAVVSAVQFRLIPLPDTLVAESPDKTKLRNHLAYRFFGAPETASFARNPFGPSLAKYGLLDALRDNPLTDCDVPLAVLYWTLSAGIKFIDLWSVRRRVTRKAVYSHWEPSASDRRQSEGEAAFLQFQDQLDSVIQEESATLSGLRADQRFEFLPAAGYLPVAAGGFDWETFLGPFAARQISVDEGIMREILHRSFFIEPIKVGSFADGRQSKIAPPVPVDVFTVPGQDNFVLFARSTNSRIRVFLKPIPQTTTGLNIEAATESSSETNDATASSDGPWFEIQAAPDSYTVDVTLPGYEKPAPAAVAGIGGRTSDIEISLTPLPRGSILITVQDNQTKGFINDEVQSLTVKDSDGVSTDGKATAAGWVVSNLLPDTYDLSVLATGHSPGSASNIEVKPNQVANVKIFLDAKAPPKDQPKGCVDTTAQIKAKGYDLRICVKPQNIAFKGTRTTGLIAVTLDKAGDKWANQWQDWLDRAYDGLGIAESEPRVYLDSRAVLSGRSLQIEQKPQKPKAGMVITDKEMMVGNQEVMTLNMQEIKQRATGPEGLLVFGKVSVPLTVTSLDIF